MTAAIPKLTARAALTSQTQVLRQNLKTPIPAPRIALERKISIRFPHFQGFLTEYSSNVSITGMFVRARFPQRPGTILDFEFNLNDGLKLIRGTGEVVWVRRKDDGDLPAGMGIRFLRLDPESRRLIRWAVEKQIDEGAKPFDLDAGREEDPPVPPEPIPQAPPPSPAGKAPAYPYAGYAAARPIRRNWLPAAAAGTLLLAVLAGIALWRPANEPDEPAAQPGEPATEPAAPVVLGAPAAPAPAGEAREEWIQMTQDWARAWAEQRPEEYLGFYSQRFQPPAASRAEWQAARRVRLRQPDFIQVKISGLETEGLTAVRARVVFDQAYRSDNYRDVTRKTLELVLEDGAWKILEERSGT